MSARQSFPLPVLGQILAQSANLGDQHGDILMSMSAELRIGVNEPFVIPTVYGFQSSDPRSCGVFPVFTAFALVLVPIVGFVTAWAIVL